MKIFVCLMSLLATVYAGGHGWNSGGYISAPAVTYSAPVVTYTSPSVYHGSGWQGGYRYAANNGWNNNGWNSGDRVTGYWVSRHPWYVGNGYNKNNGWSYNNNGWTNNYGWNRNKGWSW